MEIAIFELLSNNCVLVQHLPRQKNYFSCTPNRKVQHHRLKPKAPIVYRNHWIIAVPETSDCADRRQTTDLHFTAIHDDSRCQIGTSLVADCHSSAKCAILGPECDHGTNINGAERVLPLITPDYMCTVGNAESQWRRI